jgi:hypothetical protein
MAVELRTPPEQLLPRLSIPGLDFTPAPGADELFRWAQFLAQGEQADACRQRSIDALIEAADHDRDALYSARMYALRALRNGAGTRRTLELLDATIERISA